MLIVTINSILYSLYATEDRGPWSASAAVFSVTLALAILGGRHDMRLTTEISLG